MSTFNIALVLFATTYILLFVLPNYRAYVALGAAVVFTVWLSFFTKDWKSVRLLPYSFYSISSAAKPNPCN